MTLARRLNQLFATTSRGPSRRGRSKLRAQLQAHPRVEALEIEPTDGWFVTLKSGWRFADDPICAVHCFGASTLTEAARKVRDAERCECDDCREDRYGAAAVRGSALAVRMLRTIERRARVAP